MDNFSAYGICERSLGLGITKKMDITSNYLSWQFVWLCGNCERSRKDSDSNLLKSFCLVSVVFKKKIWIIMRYCLFRARKLPGKLSRSSRVLCWIVINVYSEWQIDFFIIAFVCLNIYLWWSLRDCNCNVDLDRCKLKRS